MAESHGGAAGARPCGNQALYLRARGGEIYFGSELKAILLHPEIERASTAPDSIITFRSITFRSAHFGGGNRKTSRAMDGMRDGRVSSAAYWRVDFRPDPRLDIESAKTSWIICALSVREHLISDVPLGVGQRRIGFVDDIALRGGVGSRAAKDVLGLFQGRSFDESKYSAKSRRTMGRSSRVRSDPEVDIESAIEQFAFYSDEPSAMRRVPVGSLEDVRSEVTVAFRAMGG